MTGLHEWTQQGLPLFIEYRGRYVLPVVAIALVGLYYLLWGERLSGLLEPKLTRIGRRVALVLLAAVALLSVGVYNNFFNFHYGGYVNAYEFFHYYMGSKYSKELGYFNIYGAALLADVETGRAYWPDDDEINDLSTHRFRSVDVVFDDQPRYRSPFSAERWREWVADVAFFKESLGSAAWSRALRDKGYNATPVWTMVVGGGLSSRIPTDSEAGMMFLALLDALLLGAAVAGVVWAFGWWPGLLMVVLLASSYLMAHVHMKGAFLRTDFVVCLVLAVCMLKKGRFAVAGALVGYSTLSRVFPAVFLFGPAALLVWELVPAARAGAMRDVWKRLVSSRHLRFFGGFAAAVAILATASIVYAGGAAIWSDFARKMSLHRGHYHMWNVGLPSVVIAEFEPPESAGVGELRAPTGTVFYRKESHEERSGVILAIQVVALVACFFAVRRLCVHRALAFGFVPTFFSIDPTYYYYIILLLPFLFLVEKSKRATGALGVVYLFFFGLAGHWLYERWDQYFPTYYWNSVLAMFLALYVLGLAFAESRRRSLTDA